MILKQNHSRYWTDKIKFFEKNKLFLKKQKKMWQIENLIDVMIPVNIVGKVFFCSVFEAVA